MLGCIKFAHGLDMIHISTCVSLVLKMPLIVKIKHRYPQVMDVAMSICSAVAEIHQVDRSLGMAKLFASGMNIGRDAMGTMANTLILAVAGTSLNMMLMIYSYDVSFQQLMNTDFVAIEIIQCIAGSVGIVCTVPLVALLSAAVFGKKTKK